MKNYARDIEETFQFGNHLRAVRKLKGISQKELANLADVELSQISRIERGGNKYEYNTNFTNCKSTKFTSKRII